MHHQNGTMSHFTDDCSISSTLSTDDLHNQTSLYQHLIESPITLPITEEPKDAAPLLCLFHREFVDSQPQPPQNTAPTSKTEITAISPINLLPTELLEMIFVQSFERPFKLLGPHQGGPRVLARVCTRWRNVVCQCGELFASIMTPREGESYTRKMALILESAISHWSRSAPLTLDIDNSWLGAPIQSVISEASRLRSLRIRSNLEDLHMYRWRTDLSSLTHIRLSVRWDMRNTYVRFYKLSPFDISTRAPRLSSLDLHLHTDFAFPREYLHLPYSQLTTVSLKLTCIKNTVSNTLHLLELCTNLITFEDQTHHSRSNPDPVERDRFTCRHLEKISVKSLDVLRFINCPKLKTFDYAHRWHDPSPVVENFIYRSACRVQTLTTIYPLDESQHGVFGMLVNAFASCSSLTRLEIDLQYSSVFRGFALVEPGPNPEEFISPLAPKLEVIKLTLPWYGPYGESHERMASLYLEVMDAIESRWRVPGYYSERGFARLRCLELDFVAVLKGLVERGGVLCHAAISTWEALEIIKTSRLYRRAMLLEEEGMALNVQVREARMHSTISYF